MRIIAQRTIAKFMAAHPETITSLSRWVKIAKNARWMTTNDVQQDFAKAKVINGERVRFEVAGGNFRMIAAFHFEAQVVFIKFLGTHADYERMDAETVSLF